MKNVITVVIILPLFSWFIWSYFSQSIAIEEEIAAESSVTTVPKVNTSQKIFAGIAIQHTPQKIKRTQERQQRFEEKLELLEEKYMGCLENLARLLERHNLTDLSIGDEMPQNLPDKVASAWKSYLRALEQLEKLKNQQNEIEEDFIQMAHQGMSLALIERN